MTRRLLLGFALVLAAAAGWQLCAEVAYALRTTRTVAALLPHDGTDAGAVVLVFHPGDCSAEGDLLARWDDRFRSAGFPVSAAMVRTPERPWAVSSVPGAVRAAKLPIRTISGRDAAIVAERLGYASTPFAVVFDREGRVVASFPATQEVPDSVVARMIRGG